MVTLWIMVSKVQTLSHRLLTRRCVACGYDGTLLHAGHADCCAKCGCDLKSRPPRSYAEMEGLLGQPIVLHTPLYEPAPQERLLHRWLAFLFISLLGILAILYLTAAALGA